MTTEDTVRQVKGTHIEARQGNPIGGNETQGQAKQLEMEPLLLQAFYGVKIKQNWK